MHFTSGKMNGNDTYTVPLVSVSTNSNYFGDMMEALEQGDAAALKEAVSHLSPSELNQCFTHCADEVINIPQSDMPAEIREDLSQRIEISICPVHYAAKMGDKSSLEILLSWGADPNMKDGFGQTPLHILPKCDWKNNATDFQGCLDILLANESINLSRLDLTKSTPFSRAEQYQWPYMVNRLKEMGVYGNFVPFSDPQNSKSNTVLADTLLENLFNRNLSGFKSTLDAIKASGIEKETVLNESHGSYTLLQYACSCGMYSFIEQLLTSGASPTRKDGINFHSPIIWATNYGYHRILEKLIIYMKQEDFDGGSIRDCNEMGETPLHLSAKCKKTEDNDEVNYYECLKILLQNKKHLNIDAINDDGNTALHFAALCDDVRAFSSLLMEGADYTVTNVFGISALQYVNKTGMLKILDDCVQFNTQLKMVDKNFWIKLNYDMMQTDHDQKVLNGKEMTFLISLAKYFQDKDVLHHPLVDIFTFLKWQNSKRFFFINFAFHLIFLVLILIYICLYHSNLHDSRSSNDSGKMNGTTNNEPLDSSNYIENNEILRTIFIALLLLTLSIRETLQLFMMKSWKEYFSKSKNITEVVTSVLAVLLVCMPFNERLKMSIAAWLVLVSLLEFVLHLGRFPKFAVYITMFSTVAWSFFRFICLFSLIILAFSFSFYLMFQVSESFRTFPESLLKTVVMTTGEIDYSDLPVSAFPVASHVLMVLFVFLILLVLVNLLNGLAISDIQEIQKRAEIISSRSLIDWMAQLERAFYCTKDSKNPFRKIFHYLFCITLTIGKCLPEHHLTIYTSQGELRYKTSEALSPVICSCHSIRLEDKHITALKQIVMGKKRPPVHSEKSM